MGDKKINFDSLKSTNSNYSTSPVLRILRGITLNMSIVASISKYGQHSIKVTYIDGGQETLHGYKPSPYEFYNCLQKK